MSENHPDFLTLACCYDTDSQGAKELRQKNHVRVLTVDVTQRESIEKLLKEVEVIMNVENVCKKILNICDFRKEKSRLVLFF